MFILIEHYFAPIVMESDKDLVVEHILGTTTIRTDVIIVVEYNDYACSGNFTIEDMKVANEKLAKFIDVENFEAKPTLVKAKKLRSMKKEVRDYSAEITANAYKALATLVESPMSRIAANLYIKFNKPPYPTRIFTNEAKAMDWLRTFL